ncbi:hypothetical protein P4C99_14320 [Pontiellaceae bacterium B1224]|nr:hypothetical protein [Pontiellaceae bacterium B1224]
MKMHQCLPALLCIVMCSCSDRPAKSVPINDPDAASRKHEQITRQSILFDFVQAISSNHYDVAFAMLHPKLAEAWTSARFSNDWKSLKARRPSKWNATATESFSGTSPQGPYEQAVYRLGSDPRSSPSLELVSMLAEGKSCVVKVYIRLPESDQIPALVSAQTSAFISAMLQEDYRSVQALFSESGKAQYTAAILERIRPFLGDTPDHTATTYYRLLANSVWYEVIMLRPPNDPATHLELIMQYSDSSVEIVSLNFKGRM